VKGACLVFGQEVARTHATMRGHAWGLFVLMRNEK